MKTRIANRLIRAARRLDPNSCVDFHPLPTGPAILNVNTINTTGDYHRAADLARAQAAMNRHA